jgi:capsular exopolysaccharide synthesis family protein
MTTSSNPTEGNPEDLERILTVLRRRAVLIVACALLTAVAAFGFSKRQTKEYTATASIVFDSGQLSQQVAGLQPVNSSETAVEQSTRVKLLELGPTATQTAEELNRQAAKSGGSGKGRRKEQKQKRGKQAGKGAQSGKGGPEVTPEQVKSSVSISPQGESDVVDVSATTTSPKRSARLANAYAHSFVSTQVASNQKYFAGAKKVVERQYQALPGEEKEEPQGLALLNRIQSLAILAKLKTGEAKVLRAASAPTSPSSPKATRNTILGAVLGLLVGLALAFLLERLNRRLREPEEAQEAFGLPVLGTVPESKAINASNKGTSAAELPFTENEAFRMLRASLRYFNVDEDVRTVLVTSYGAGVGKSTISWNLARVAATGSRTVIVETDLRNPTIARQHGLEPGPGLSEVLTRQTGLDAAVQFKPVATDASANGSDVEEPTLHAITAGTQPPNPAELLESEAMEELLAQLRERYALVVIDTAPLGVVSDCFPLLRRVNGVIAVARMGRSTLDSVVKMREQLAHLDAPTLGIVANGLKLGRRGRHGYGYGYYGKPSERPTAETAQPLPAPNPSQAPLGAPGPERA